ncbi:MAG: hypothetical protein C4292_03630 [Nitrososphaera sp.]
MTTNKTFTSYGTEKDCQFYDKQVEFHLDPQALTIINYTMMIGTLVGFFVIFKRTMTVIRKRGASRA